MLTAVDACNVSRYRRNQLRGVLDTLPEYMERPTSARVAREFSRLDLLVLSVVHFLDRVLHVRRPAIRRITEQLRTELGTPRAVNHEARLFISFNPSTVRYLEAPEALDNGVQVPLGPIFRRVDVYIAGGEIDDDNPAPTPKPEPEHQGARPTKSSEGRKPGDEVR